MSVVGDIGLSTWSGRYGIVVDVRKSRFHS
jgi:hypothetical protein